MTTKPSSLLNLPGEPTLDSVIARHPVKISDAELDAVIAHMRAERAEWLTKEQKREARKEAKALAEVERDIGPERAAATERADMCEDG